MNTFNRSAAICRWTGRILGGLLVSLTVVIAVGEGMPNPFTQPALVQLGFLALALIVTGILAGWRWELAGAIISLAGWLMFLPVARGLTWFLSALALPGALYLISAVLRRHFGKSVSV